MNKNNEGISARSGSTGQIQPFAGMSALSFFPSSSEPLQIHHVLLTVRDMTKGEITKELALQDVTDTKHIVIKMH